MPHKDPVEAAAYFKSYHAERHERDPEYREKRKADARKAAKVRRHRIRAMLHEAKTKPCVDCGNSYPPQIMDLDHVRGEKEFTPSQAINGKCGYISYERLAAEIAKCDPRCPTCHRLRHFREDGDLWQARGERRAAVGKLHGGRRGE